jgi:tetratricopeptide (TPR) repeat protein
MNRILIKSTVLAGLFLGALVCIFLISLSLAPERLSFADPGGGRDLFRRLLRGYDDFLAMGESRPPGRTGPTQDQLNALSLMLDRIEKNAQGAESWLSVLKRRRDLAFRSPRFLSGYREAAGRAAGAFPWSQPIAAMAAEALLYDTARDKPSSGAVPEPENAEALKTYASLITETRFSPLVLAILVLTGELDNPAKARAAGADGVLASGLPLIRDSLSGDEGERLGADLGLLLLLRGDYTGASSRIRGFSAENRSPALRRLAAEYFYDFGEPLRAAELFYRLGTEEGMLRSADALWLGERREAARNTWRILAAGTGSAGGEEGSPDISPAARLRSLYNLAASPSDPEEEASRLSALYLAGESDPGLRSDPLYVFGIIRYTRLMEPQQAAGILEGRVERDPLAGLELLRRRSELQPVERTVAETWLLLGRYPEEDRLYRWAAWYFNFQRKYEETGVLIKTANRQGIGGAWLDLNAALPLMRQGKLDEAENLLRAIPPEAGFWQAGANRGRILESRRAPRAALEQYNAAASLANDDPAAASRVLFRMAGCFRALGQTGESRDALRRSLELNPGNLPARLELENLGY